MTTLTSSKNIVTPSGTPLGGWVHVEVSDNGDFFVKFHMHSSSILGNFDFNLRAYLTAPGFPTMAFIKSGHVSGVDSWDHEEHGHSPLLALYWAQLAAAPTYGVAKDYQWGGVVGTLQDLVEDIFDIAAGAVGTALGVVIGATREAIDWMGATLGPGGTLGVVGGVVVFAVAAAAGAGIGAALIMGTVAGVAIGAVTNALIEYRHLNGAEVALARQVYGNSMPYDKIMISNLAGLGGRAFTAPGVDGKTYCNLGKAYENPLGPGGDAYPQPGQLLIHELAHAWQSAHTSFLPGLMCSGMVNQAQFLLGDNVYAYGPSGPGWSEFNAEQQGSIVDQWFGASKNSGRYKMMDQQNPYYRYIWHDVIGRFPSDDATANLRSAASGGLSAFAHHRSRLEVFWARRNGAVGSHWWDAAPSQNWGDHSPVDIAGAGSAPARAAVSGLSREPRHVDAFWVGSDGAIMTQWSAPGAGWASHTAFAIAPPGSAHPGSPVAAVARSADNVDVFWVRPDGAVCTQWWASAPGGGWAEHGAFPITAPGAAEPDSAVAVVARTPQHLDVFWITPDQAIGTRWWAPVPGGGWAEHGNFAITAAKAARSGSPVTVVARTPDNLDVYWIGPDGSVRSQWWHVAAGHGWADHGAFAVAPAGEVGEGGGVTATARTPNNLDVFWVAPDGSIRTQWWHAAAGHSWADHSAFEIAPPGSADPASTISAAGRMPAQLDVFWVRGDGAIATHWWNAAPNQGWNDHPPFAITAAGEATVPHAVRTLNLLEAVGVDFSVPTPELTEWLRDAEFTPYPALTEALLARLNSRWLRKPVFLDVIAFNYENSAGGPSPRKAVDVKTDVLEAAVLEGFNTRYNDTIPTFDALLVP
ncbi:hypothetical protein IU409_25660 [Nocardia cyriacigeorgica]|uniref:hypothetical protein n=1 Tax=Nocardia cyriacigeorgica TaxID=135487 RepID=UPI001894998A|nr:hypothetical protein [Nocardia cyriacigeorgica]MBF6346873.1 hypothetical protein [Nocardia cyriacigeorgica]